MSDSAGLTASAETARPVHRRVLAASKLKGDRVRNRAGEELGTLQDIMIDVHNGRVAYAVLASGGFLGMGGKLLAIPWSTLRIDEDTHEFLLDVERGVLEAAPGFDKDNWPDFADADFGSRLHLHYGQTPYWEHDVTDAGDYVGDGRQPNRSIEFDPSVGYRAGKK